MHGKSTFSLCRRPSARSPLALALLLALGLAPLTASAATVTVTSAADPVSGTTTCTLRQAIASMNAGAPVGASGCSNSGAAFGSSDTITFSTAAFPSGGSNDISLTTGRLAITDSQLSIDASPNGNVTIHAQHHYGVMRDSAAAGGSLTLTHLTLTGGIPTSGLCNGVHGGGGLCVGAADVTLAYCTVSGNGEGSADIAFMGAGIFSNSGSITLNHSTVSGNVAASNNQGNGNRGGGIASNSGNITLTHSTVSGNNAYADGGGGGIATVTGNISVDSSTVSDNVAGGSGSGILSASGDITLVNSTVSGNNIDAPLGPCGSVNSGSGNIGLTNSTVSGNLGGASYSSGVCTSTGSITANNSIVAGNQGIHNISPTTYTGSHDLIGNSVTNLDLGPLQDNGGPTKTMLPQAGSVAIDAGACHVTGFPPDKIPTVDQRGVARPQGATCDIGAVEAGGPDHLSLVSGSNQNAVIWHNFPNALMVQLHGAAPGNAPQAGITLHITVPTTPGQPSATCTDGVTNSSGYASLCCRANGVGASGQFIPAYSVYVHAVGWSGVTPLRFYLANLDDGDTIFLDGFDPPGPVPCGGSLPAIVANGSTPQP